MTYLLGKLLITPASCYDSLLNNEDGERPMLRLRFILCKKEDIKRRSVRRSAKRAMRGSIIRRGLLRLL